LLKYAVKILLAIGAIAVLNCFAGAATPIDVTKIEAIFPVTISAAARIRAVFLTGS
jgi:hypothetical protein